MVTAAFTALKSTNDDLGIVLLWLNCEGANDGSGMNRSPQVILCPTEKGGRRQNMPQAASLLSVLNPRPRIRTLGSFRRSQQNHDLVKL